MKKEHLGSNFDEFLAEEGVLTETAVVAVKRVIAFQIDQMMRDQNLSKSEMARRMNTSRAALERLLDPENQSVTLHTIEKAAQALGKRLQIVLA